MKFVWYSVGTAVRGYMEGAIPRYDNQPPPMASVTYVLLKHFSRRVLQIKESLRCKLSLLILHFTRARILFITLMILQFYAPSQSGHYILIGRVAELGSLLSGAKMAMKIFVKRVFTIFASNASFLRVIANLQN